MSATCVIAWSDLHLASPEQTARARARVELSRAVRLSGIRSRGGACPNWRLHAHCTFATPQECGDRTQQVISRLLKLEGDETNKSQYYSRSGTKNPGAGANVKGVVCPSEYVKSEGRKVNELLTRLISTRPLQATDVRRAREAPAVRRPPANYLRALATSLLSGALESIFAIWCNVFTVD